MGFLAQTTRPALLSIGGQDFTDSFISFYASDPSVFKNGLLPTSGTLELGQSPGQFEISSYSRDLFKRGTVVTLDMQEPGGTVYRHPRGYLYVVSVAYSPEDEKLEIELGCRIALAYLTEDVSEILPLVPIPLDPARETMQNCSASFASASQILYQDNQGDLVSSYVFGTNGFNLPGSDWVSILGETALAASPLQGATALPDVINLSYNFPNGGGLGGTGDDQSGRIDENITTSRYFLTYPASTWVRRSKESCTDTDASGRRVDVACVEPLPPIPRPQSRPSSTCGTPPPMPNVDGETGNSPSDGGLERLACNENWTTEPSPQFLPATKVATERTEYKGPSAQVSTRTVATVGPAVEVNSQYYSDVYAFCVSAYGIYCAPNGGCSFAGMEAVQQSRTITTYEYGRSSELVSTLQETFVTQLSAAQPFDWRSGLISGQPQDFRYLSASAMFRSQVVEVNYSKEGNNNVQTTTTWTSIAAGGQTGIDFGNLDALSGIKTVTKRLSSTNIPLDLRPDTPNSPVTQTEEASTVVVLFSDSYVSPPTEAGPYVVDESIGVPLRVTFEDRAAIVNRYETYIKRLYQGDIMGMQISESMRPEIVSTWKPNTAFYYYDPGSSVLMLMQMDATTWGVTKEEALFTTSAIWIANATGTPTVPSNLVGNSTPSEEGIGRLYGRNGDGTPTAPGPSPAPPDCPGCSSGESYYEIIDVEMTLSTSAENYCTAYICFPPPGDQYPEIEFGLTFYAVGFIVGDGDVLETTRYGGLPVSANGSLIVENATVVNSDLFSSD